MVITCSDNPLEVSLESLAEVLLHSDLSEGLSALHARPLVAELSANGGDVVVINIARTADRVYPWAWGSVAVVLYKLKLCK